MTNDRSAKLRLVGGMTVYGAYLIAAVLAWCVLIIVAAVWW